MIATLSWEYYVWIMSELVHVVILKEKKGHMEIPCLNNKIFINISSLISSEFSLGMFRQYTKLKEDYMPINDKRKHAIRPNMCIY